METLRLRQFKVIVDAGGLLRASELLGISGGGLSKSMKALESELGFAIFEQRGRGLELTPAGEKLYAQVPSVLKTIEDVMHLREASPSAEQFLRIVSFEVFTTYFLGSMVAHAFKNRPLEVRQAIPGHMETMIANGESDLGITYLPIPHAQVEFLKVGRIKMGAFGLKEAVKGRDLAEVPFVVPVVPKAGTPSGVQGLDGWPEHLFARRIEYRVETMATAIQICRRGSAVAFLPEFVAKMANAQTLDKLKLWEVPLPTGVKTVYRDVHLIHRKGYRETKEIRELAKAIRALS